MMIGLSFSRTRLNCPGSKNDRQNSSLQSELGEVLGRFDLIGNIQAGLEEKQGHILLTELDGEAMSRVDCVQVPQDIQYASQ
jgi:hypothetical protein